MGTVGWHAEEGGVCNGENGSVPPVVFHESSDNEKGVFTDCRRIVLVLWVRIITTSSELRG
jgi:hypothetical protein